MERRCSSKQASRLTRFGAGAAQRRRGVWSRSGGPGLAVGVCRDSCLLSVSRGRKGTASSSHFPSRGLVVRVATETESSEPRLLGRLVYILTFSLTFSTVALRRMVKAKG